MWNWLLRGLFVVAAGFLVWKVYDVFAAAFRERAEYRDKFQSAAESLNERTTERDAARETIERQAKAITAEIKARDAAAKANDDRAKETDRKLRNAQRKLAEWEGAAEPEMARCLRLPLPRWLLDGTEEAAPAIPAGLAAVLPGKAGPDVVGTGTGPDR